jgi:hypothetical protein
LCNDLVGHGQRRPEEARDTTFSALINTAQDDDKWPEEFIAAREQAIVIPQERQLFEGEEAIVPVLAGLTDQSRMRLKPKTVRIYGAGLESINIDCFTPIQDFLHLEGNGDVTVKQSKFDLTFIVMPCVFADKESRCSVCSDTNSADASLCRQRLKRTFGRVTIESLICDDRIFLNM